MIDFDQIRIESEWASRDAAARFWREREESKKVRAKILSDRLLKHHEAVRKASTAKDQAASAMDQDAADEATAQRLFELSRGSGIRRTPDFAKPEPPGGSGLSDDQLADELFAAGLETEEFEKEPLSAEEEALVDELFAAGGGDRI